MKTIVRRVVSLCFVGVAFAVLAGCGGGAPPTAADIAAHAGPVKKASALVGTWYRLAAGPFDGFEFLKDGTVIVTAEGGAQTMRYSVLDGGRLSLVAPGGTTFIFGARTTDDGLALTNDQLLGAGKSLAFRRLPEGQTVAQAAEAARVAAEQARRERLAAEAKARNELLASLGKLFAEPKLAVANVDRKLRVDRIALSSVHGGNGAWVGIALVEGNVVLAREAMLALQKPAGEGQPYRVVLHLGKVLGPPGAQQIRTEDMVFAVTGSPAKPVLQADEHVLAANADAFDDLAARFKKTVAAREAAINQFLAQFGGYSELEGVLTDPTRPTAQPRTMRIAVLRVVGKPELQWANVSRSANLTRDAFKGHASVVLDGDVPWLQIDGVGVFKAVTTKNETTLQGKVQNFDAVFTRAYSLSAEALTKRQAVVAQFMGSQLAAGVRLFGQYIANDLPSTPVWPAYFELKGDGVGKLSGEYLNLSAGQKYPVTGTIEATLLGAQIKLQSGRGVSFFGDTMQRNGPPFVFDVDWRGRTEERPFTPVIRGTMASLKMTWDAGDPAFVGTMPGHSTGNRFNLHLVSAQNTEKYRAQVKQWLARGLTLEESLPERAGGQEPRVLKLNGGAGSVTTAAASYGRRGDVPATVHEREENGFMVYDIDQVGVPAKRISALKLRLWALPLGEGVMLTGFARFADENPPRVVPLRGYWNGAR